MRRKFHRHRKYSRVIWFGTPHVGRGVDQPSEIKAQDVSNAAHSQYTDVHGLIPEIARHNDGNNKAEKHFENTEVSGKE